MDGRIFEQTTPTKRVCAAFRAVLIRYSVPVPPVPDYADLEALLEPFIEVELERRSQEDSHTLYTPLRIEMIQDNIRRLTKECHERKL